MKSQLIQDVINCEWEMFSNVQNVGGKASCQLDPTTFSLMRFSQIDIWSEEILASYLADLKAAKKDGRNLMSEKYARMMEFSFPEEYALLHSKLPAVSDEAAALVEEIVAVNVEWKANVDARFPKLARHGRPLRTARDLPGLPSLETYLRAELKTYSANTLRLLRDWTLDRKAKGINDAENNLLRQVQGYGYQTIEDAEKGVSE